MNKKLRLMALTLVMMLISTGCMTCAEIEGSEVAVVETTSGPEEFTLNPGFHMLFGIRNDVYTYPINDQTFIMGETTKGKSEIDEGELVVKTRDSQKVWVSFTLRYALDRAKIIYPCRGIDGKELAGFCGIHVEARDIYESKWIRPEASRIIKDLASTYTAKEIYAAKRKSFNDEIELGLNDNKDLGKKGIMIKTFVLDLVRLEPEYEKAISDTMLQEQLKEKAEKEAEASKQAAVAAREKAQAEVEIKTQKAEAKKQERMKAAEAERFEAEQKAIGLLAQGKAEAEVSKLKKNAEYDGVAGERRMKVEIARHQAEAAKGLFANANVVGGMTVEAMMQDLLTGLSVKK
jgi:regulator of protease activity HflC (stomatin/prohibitin superfamily)